VDISEAGLGVSLPDEYHIEGPVRAWLLFGDQRLLRCEGVLRHRTDGRIGIELAESNTEHLVALRQLSGAGEQVPGGPCSAELSPRQPSAAAD
jgi:hypothetical protein